MDELTTLTRIRANLAASDDALGTARAQLADAMIQASGGSRPRYPRRVGWIGGGTLAAGALALTLVFTTVGGGVGADKASAAEAVLNKASVDTIKVTDPVLAEGQYYKVSETYTVADGDLAPSGTPEAWIRSGTIDTYVPKDRTADWTQIQTSTGVVKTYTPEGKILADAQLAKVKAKYPNGLVYRAKNGEYWPGQQVPWSDAKIAAMPRDPAALLKYVHASNSGKSNDSAFEFISRLLEAGMVPADLRAALYKAIALIPGVEVTANSTAIDGRTGIAIGRVESNGNNREDLIIDQTTGTVIGWRTVQLTTKAKGGPPVPTGTVVESSATTVSIADAAPRLPAQNPVPAG